MLKLPETDEPSSWGKLLMVGLPGPQADAVARELVRDLRVGGVILFARNLESPEQVWRLTRDLQRLAREAGGPPLLIAVDQEGGRVQRLKAPFTIIPSARELAAGSTPAEVANLSRQVARELALVGVNVNLAPVLDVARGPECPMGDRSYGPDPELVAAFAVAAIKGYLDGGVIPVAKHFPGLGDTLADSHEVLPAATSPDPERRADLLPFRRAVAAAVPAVMTAHLLAPRWDAVPATLSRVALHGWLRQRLGFQGIIITDDLEMGAIARQQLVPQAARQALAAGADLLLICQDCQAAWETGRLLARDHSLLSRGQEAARRLARLRNSLPWPDDQPEAVTAYFQGRKK